MKQSIRFFSIGLLVASVIFFGFYFLLSDTNTSAEDLPVEDMVSEIESQGYRVITEDEFISFTLSKEDNIEKDEKSEQDNKDKKDSSKKKSDNKKDKSKKKKDKDKKDEDKKDDVVKATFTTEDGVVTQDIADILVDEEIIDDRQEFLDYLDDNDYSPYIQIGTFKVSSDMSKKELAEVITTYPGD